MKQNLFVLKMFLLVLILAASGNTKILAQGIGEITVTGVITDEGNIPIPGVNIIQSKTSNGVVTNFDGKYSITVPQNSVLVFSFVGFVEQRIKVNGRTEINIQLVGDIDSLDEVVVIGYGTQKRRDITGSVTSVKGEELRSATSTSFSDALRGKAPGVMVTSGSGEPGSGVDIKIRGVSSISASSSPLYVIDGVPVDGGSSGPNSLNPLSYLDPNSIESIEVLKDASAAAIYGSRGAAGVVLITTKSSNPSGETTISFNSTYGISSFNGGYDLLNAPEYAEYQHIAHPENELYTNEETGEPIPYAASETTDWQELIIQDAPTQTYNIGLNSGNRDNNLYVGLGYSNTEGVVLNSSFERYSLALNSNTKISDRLSFGMRTNTGYTIRNGQISGIGTGGRAGILNRIFTSRPVNAFISDDSDSNYTNPLQFITLSDNKNFNFRTNINATLSYDFLDNLTLKISGGGFIANSKDKFFVSKEIVNAANLNGQARLGGSNQVNWLNENTLTYKGATGAHSIEALIGFTQQQNVEESFEVGVNDFPSEINRGDAIQNALAVPNYNSNKLRWALQSYLGRIIYSYDDKYILTSSLRVDGSSKFIGENKYSVFPAFALAWQLGDEKIFEDVDFLEQLKIRAGYGKLGNQSIPPYSALGRISTEYYYYGDTRVIAASYSSIPNKDLKWETSETFNAGIDVSLYNGRINLKLDAYVKNTKDLLLNAPIAGSSGYQTIFQNIGSVRNKGVELGLSTVNISTDNFTWSTDFNISANRNKILDLGSQDNILIGRLPPGVGVSPNVLTEGEPIGSFYGYVFDGLYQLDDFNADGQLLEGIPAFGSPQPGFMRFKDISGPDGEPDGVVDALDRTIIGDPNPKHYGGLGNKFTYKNFDLNIFFAWQYGHELLNWSTSFLSGRLNDNLRRDLYQNMYTPTNTDTNIPTYADDNGKSNVSSYYVEDASFLRLQNITLRYRLGENTLKNIGVKSASLGVIIDNLFLWTDYSGLDPEQTSYGQNTGTDFFAYPRPKTVSFNVNVKF